MANLRDILRAANQRRKARRLIRREPITTPMGFRFVGTRDMQEGRFEPGMTALLGRLFDVTDLFVNVGANTGYHVCHALSKGKRTIAVEPGPNTFPVLTRNLQLNGWGPEVMVLPLACGSETGLVTLYGEGTGASVVAGWSGNPQMAGHTVPIVPLDRIIKVEDDTRLLVLMDVEGHEFAALKGASDLVRRSLRPIWIVEISLSAHQPNGAPGINPNFCKTLSLFREAGYVALLPEAADPEPGWEALFDMPHAEPLPFAYENFVFCEPGLRHVVLGNG